MKWILWAIMTSSNLEKIKLNSTETKKPPCYQQWSLLGSGIVFWGITLVTLKNTVFGSSLQGDELSVIYQAIFISSLCVSRSCSHALHYFQSLSAEWDQLPEFLLPMYGFKPCVHQYVLHSFQGGERWGRQRVTGQGSCWVSDSWFVCCAARQINRPLPGRLNQGRVVHCSGWVLQCWWWHLSQKHYWLLFSLFWKDIPAV